MPVGEIGFTSSRQVTLAPFFFAEKHSPAALPLLYPVGEIGFSCSHFALCAKRLARFAVSPLSQKAKVLPSLFGNPTAPCGADKLGFVGALCRGPLAVGGICLPCLKGGGKCVALDGGIQEAKKLRVSIFLKYTCNRHFSNFTIGYIII